MYSNFYKLACSVTLPNRYECLPMLPSAGRENDREYDSFRVRENDTNTIDFISISLVKRGVSIF